MSTTPIARGAVGPLPVACLDVPSIIQSLPAPRGEILAALRVEVLAWPGVDERAMYDAFCREWTPAYYLGQRQLFHVHNFHAGLRATVFVGVRTLEPLLLDAETVPPALRLLVARAKGRATKMVKVPLDSLDDVPGFLELVRVKWRWGRRRSSKLASHGHFPLHQGLQGTHHAGQAGDHLQQEVLLQLG